MIPGEVFPAGGSLVLNADRVSVEVEVENVADRPIHFFHLPDDIVWGATARILYELLGLVAFAADAGRPSAGEGGHQ